jgi:hypothetical protein
MKCGINCLSLSKIWSAKAEVKSTVSRVFKNPELFSIKLSEGVILECRMEKNSPKKDAYFKNMVISCSLIFLDLACCAILTWVR